MRGSRQFDDTDLKSKKVITSADDLFSAEIWEKQKKVYTSSLLYISHALDLKASPTV